MKLTKYLKEKYNDFEYNPTSFNNIFDKNENVIIQIICAIWMFGIIGIVGYVILFLIWEILLSFF